MIPDIPFAQHALPYFVVAFTLGYLCGSVPFGLLVARMLGLGDIRQIGSGNIGTSNVLRSGNKLAALLTLLLDAAKGWLPAFAALELWGPLTAAIAGLGAVVGHCFPVWLRFRGGKGVATALGVLLAWHWMIAAYGLAVWLVVAAIWRMTSLAALVTCVAVPALLWWFREFEYFAPGVILALIIVIRHTTNIQALLSGTERKINLRSRGK